MMFRLLVTTFLFTLTLAQSEGNIIGCQEVECPEVESYPRCTLATNTLLGVGQATISDAPSALSGISLVKGANVSSTSAEERAYKSLYYLATPENMNINDIDGCAVFLNDGPTQKFDGRIESSTGRCLDVMEGSCIGALTGWAANFTSNTTGGNSCSSMQSQMSEQNFPECQNLTGQGAGLGSFTVVSLSDLTNIDNAANSSSDCWPVLPKSDNLAEITENVTMGAFNGDAFFDQVYKITPVLTVFLNGSSSLINETSSQLTCLKVVNEVNLENGEANAASTLLGSLLGVAGVPLLIAGMIAAL